MKNEFLSAAILGAAVVIAFLVGFPLGSIARNALSTPSTSEVMLLQQ
ncbi:hypothetical protein [Allocoleopsis sp.]